MNHLKAPMQAIHDAQNLLQAASAIWITDELLGDSFKERPYRVRAEVEVDGSRRKVEYAHTGHHDRHCFTMDYDTAPVIFNVLVWFGRLEGFMLRLSGDVRLSVHWPSIIIQRQLDGPPDLNCVEDLRLKQFPGELIFERHESWVSAAPRQGRKLQTVRKSVGDASEDEWWTVPLMNRVPLIPAEHLGYFMKLLQLAKADPACCTKELLNERYYSGPTGPE